MKHCDRREFIRSSALAAAGLTLGGYCGTQDVPKERVPYGDTIGDRLWMWGHHAMSFATMKGAKEKGAREWYNLPFDRRIDMADACREMGIPGCFIVRWRRLPTKEELPEYMKQFANTKRIGFSITDSAPESFNEKVRLGLEYADKMPNLTSFVMDDYWSGAGKVIKSISELVAVREKLVARGMKLSVVLYADANGVKPEFKNILDLCDEITFWFWKGKNTDGIEGQVAKLRDLIGPEKPVLLGQYMWDFGSKKPMPGATMENQLAQTTRLLAAKAIHGVIFHCTPLVDMDLDAVKVSRTWIKENSARRWGI